LLFIVLEDALAGRENKQESKVYASLLFFTVVIATPWFIWKLLKSLNTEQTETKGKWFEGNDIHLINDPSPFDLFFSTNI